MTVSLDHPLTIGHVRVQLTDDADPDIHQWRWPTQSALNHVSLAGFGLPPQSILIVRQVLDPKPGQLLAEDRWHSTNQWGQGLHNWLSDHWRQAVRPAFQSVPAHAGLVWFADLAEWLACLSWDIFAGGAHQHWWWHTWLQSMFYGDVGDMLFALWQDNALSLPQTLALLTKWHSTSAIALLHQLTTQQVTVLQEVVANRYELPTDVNPVRLIEQLAPLLPSSIQQLVYSLPLETASFVVLNLAIVHLPSVTHNIRHQFAVDESVETAEDYLSKTSVSDDEIVDEDYDEMADSTVDQQPESPSITPASPQQSLDSQVNPVDADDHASTIELDDTDIVDIEQPPLDMNRHVDSLPEWTGEQDTSSFDDTHYSDDRLSHIIEDDSDDSEQLLFSAENGLWTAYGGAWYLVNLLVDLNWLYHPDDGDRNPFHKLYILARELLDDEANDDLIWHILPELAEEDLPKPSGEIWLQQVLPHVYSYLNERLEQPELLQEALHDQALLYVTRTHIDVVFKLDQIRLDLRLAGLDRNPSWVAELARIITFHYE